MSGGIDVLIDFMVALKYVLVNPIKFWKKKYGMSDMMIQYSMGDWKPLWRTFVHTKRKARVRKQEFVFLGRTCIIIFNGEVLLCEDLDHWD